MPRFACMKSYSLTPGLITLSLFAGDSPVRKKVEVFHMNIVCETISSRRDTYRYTSVVANYTANSGPVKTSQFEYACDKITWTHVVFTDSAGTVTTPPDANFNTLLRSDCGLCMTARRAAGLPINITIDDNHCACKWHKNLATKLNFFMHMHGVIIIAVVLLYICIVSWYSK